MMRFCSNLSLVAGVLALASVVLAPAEAQTADGMICDVRSFGAVADDGMADTAAIQAAIDACKDKGGRVIVPSGTWDTGAFTFGSDMVFELRGGATLKLIPDMRLYPEVNPEEGPGAGLRPFHVAFWGAGVHNLTIEGGGEIDGSGPEFWDENFYDLGIGRPTLPRPQPAMELADCSNTHVRNIHFRNMPAYALRFNRCDRVSAVDVSVINDIRSPNTDGIQIRDTDNAFITRAYIVTGDDGIVIKSELKVVDNLIVSDSYIESDDGAIKYGTASRRGIRNATFSNIVINNSRFGISLFQIDGGDFTNNRFDNIIIKTGGRRDRTYPIYVDISRRNERRDLGTIDGLVFSNILIDSNSTSLIAGNSERLIRGLTLENISVVARDEMVDVRTGEGKPKGNRDIVRTEQTEDYSRLPAFFVIGNTDGLTASGIRIDERAGPSGYSGIALVNVDRALIRGLTIDGDASPILLSEGTPEPVIQGVVSLDENE